MGFGAGQIKPIRLRSIKQNYNKFCCSFKVLKAHFGDKLTLLGFQQFQYNTAKQKINKLRQQEKMNITQIELRLQKAPIPCFKYNYTLDEDCQNFNNYEALIRLTQDKEGLIITCKKPLPRHEVVSEYQEKLKNKHRNQGEENLDYKLETSSTSCKFSEIKGIIFGGISSRFWMLRKHMIQMDTQKFVAGMVPFYAWECVTL